MPKPLGDILIQTTTYHPPIYPSVCLTIYLSINQSSIYHLPITHLTDSVFPENSDKHIPLPYLGCHGCMLLPSSKPRRIQWQGKDAAFFQEWVVTTLYPGDKAADLPCRAWPGRWGLIPASFAFSIHHPPYDLSHSSVALSRSSRVLTVWSPFIGWEEKDF